MFFALFYVSTHFQDDNNLFTSSFTSESTLKKHSDLPSPVGLLLASTFV